jgi:hypothetical protein
MVLIMDFLSGKVKKYKVVLQEALQEDQQQMQLGNAIRAISTEAEIQ